MRATPRPIPSIRRKPYSRGSSLELPCLGEYINYNSTSENTRLGWIGYRRYRQHRWWVDSGKFYVLPFSLPQYTMWVGFINRNDGESGQDDAKAGWCHLLPRISITTTYSLRGPVFAVGPAANLNGLRNYELHIHATLRMMGGLARPPVLDFCPSQILPPHNRCIIYLPDAALCLNTTHTCRFS